MKLITALVVLDGQKKGSWALPFADDDMLTFVISSFTGETYAAFDHVEIGSLAESPQGP